MRSIEGDLVKLDGYSRYYYANGQLAGEVQFLNDSLVNAQYFNEDGSNCQPEDAFQEAGLIGGTQE